MQRKHSLTSQEKKVLKLLAQNDNEIAFQLCLSVNTVKTYIRRILIKLNAKNRTSAVILSINNGMVRSQDFKINLTK